LEADGVPPACASARLPVLTSDHLWEPVVVLHLVGAATFKVLSKHEKDFVI
jgi:hypothetical protein